MAGDMSRRTSSLERNGQMRKTIQIAATLLVGVASLGSSCIVESPSIAVNIDSLVVLIAVPAGTPDPTFSGNKDILPSDYVNQDFSTIQGVRVYDVRLQTIGTYTGSAAGAAQVNGAHLADFSGNWSDFNTEQSVLTSPDFTLDPAGVSALVTAVTGNQTINLAASGTVTGPAASGLQVKLRVLGQLDMAP